MAKYNKIDKTIVNSYDNDARTAHIVRLDQKTLNRADKQTYYLLALESLGTIRESTTFTGISRQQHFRWLDGDADYSLRYDRAREAFSEVLESELYRRALVGVQEDVYHQGIVVGQKTKYSDNLLLTALKANLSDKYSEKTKTTIESTSTTFNINAEVGKEGLGELAKERTAELIAQFQSVRPPTMALAEGVEVVDAK